ncbi:hypothetical protein HC864_01990 [Candidatus Gracilibacteria bacterium]|nr:hypothetical protein [Candidatus Gracilibacteria bacterium]
MALLVLTVSSASFDRFRSGIVGFFLKILVILGMFARFLLAEPIVNLLRFAEDFLAVDSSFLLFLRVSAMVFLT